MGQSCLAPKKVLTKAGRSVAKQLKTALGKLAKADDSEDEADGIVRGLDLTTLGGLIGIESMLADTAWDRGSDVLLSLGISDQSDFFDHANDRAAAYAKKRAAELVTDIDDSTRDMLRTAIADGLEAGELREGIIDDIMASDIFSEARATKIADYEIGAATGAGAQAGREEAIKAGVDLEKGWFCDENPCEDCEENQNAGWIPNDEEFPSGDMTEIAHNGCKCHTESRVKDDDNDEGEE
jgi:hypothetical protein